MKVEVIFRKDRQGEVIAIFPYIIWDYSGNLMSYLHVGQHGACGVNFTWVFPYLATSDEYGELLKELTGIGYEVKVIKRMNMNKYRRALYDRGR